MSFCDKCGNYSLDERCPCVSFTVINEDGEEHKIFALSAYNAAIKYAQKSNVDNDNYLVGSREVVTVNGKEYTIGAVKEIEYFASEN